MNENVNIRGHLSLVNRNKSRFIICGMFNKKPTIISFFNVIGRENQASLLLDNSRYHYAKKLLNALPSLFVLRSDGSYIEIDAVHKCIEFQEDNYKGIIQYELLDTSTLTTNIKSIFIENQNKEIPKYLSVKIEDDTKKIPKNLKIIPTIFESGFMITMVDMIEKILYLNIVNGLIGITSTNEMPRLLQIQSLWPEIGLELTIKDDKLFINCPILSSMAKDNCILKLHRNFGGTDICINNIATHI